MSVEAGTLQNAHKAALTVEIITPPVCLKLAHTHMFVENFMKYCIRFSLCVCFAGGAQLKRTLHTFITTCVRLHQQTRLAD